MVMKCGFKFKTMHNILEQFPILRQKAAEAEQRCRVRNIAGGRTEAILPPLVQLPLWGDELRALPNELVRSALFNARNRRQKRADLSQAEIMVIGDGRITYSGKELRQDDETVWLQLIHLAKEKPLGKPIEFSPYSLCKAIRWSINGRSYKRIKECLTRMQANAVEIYSTRLKEGVSLSMIPTFRWKDHTTGKALTHYQVTIAPALLELFGDVHYTRIEWEQRLTLPDGIATWLHGYFASHKKPHPIKLETIAQGAGLTTDSPPKVRQLIQIALNELERVRFLRPGSKIVGDLVHIQRA